MHNFHLNLEISSKVSFFPIYFLKARIFQMLTFVKVEEKGGALILLLLIEKCIFIFHPKQENLKLLQSLLFSLPLDMVLSQLTWFIIVVSTFVDIDNVLCNVSFRKI